MNLEKATQHHHLFEGRIENSIRGTPSETRLEPADTQLELRWEYGWDKLEIGSKLLETGFELCWNQPQTELGRNWPSLATLQGRRAQITVDRFPRARGKMMKNKTDGPADCLVTEMLQCLPTETVERGGVLVRQSVQSRVPGSRSVQISSFCVSQVRRQA